MKSFFHLKSKNYFVQPCRRRPAYGMLPAMKRKKKISLKPMRRHTPNLLSLFRLCSGPLCYLIFMRERWYVGALLFTIANITDFFDGYFARRYDASSKAGTFLDALADKVLVISAYTAFAQHGMLSWWVVAIIVLRDVAITWLRAFLLARRAPLTTSWFAKSKTVMQFGAAYLFIASALWALPHDALLRAVTAWAVALLTVASGLTYLPALWATSTKK